MTIVKKIITLDRFGLFEAMSAIEMMDPKMDAGMIGNQVNRKVLNLEQAIKVHCSDSHTMKTESITVIKRSMYAKKY